MARQFQTPISYHSPLISKIKRDRKAVDTRKRDLSPTHIDAGTVVFKIARHFGFCYGVENAIEIAYRALDENPDRRVFLLSEMIHNPAVNNDLLARGVQFILSPSGEQLIPFEALRADDVVILPAFGVTVEIFEKLASLGIDPRVYNATCPFVEKVWRRAAQLGEQGFTVIIHGKHFHEETRATFSHAAQNSPSLVIRNLDEARRLAEYILDTRPLQEFFTDFAERFSLGFDPSVHLSRLGVVNQTTMLAGDTREISEFLKGALIERYGAAHLSEHFADTRDTLCYATTENQNAVKALIEGDGDVALVVGGYNSSNTSHLAKLCASKVPSFHIRGAEDILSLERLQHFDMDSKQTVLAERWFPVHLRPTILITAGASTPDRLVEEVIRRVGSLADATLSFLEDDGALDPSPEAGVSVDFGENAPSS